MCVVPSLCALHLKQSSPMLTPAAVCISNYSLCSTGSQGKAGGGSGYTFWKLSQADTSIHTHPCLNWASKKQCLTRPKISHGAQLGIYSLIYSSLWPPFDKPGHWGGNMFPLEQVWERLGNLESLCFCFLEVLVKGTQWICLDPWESCKMYFCQCYRGTTKHLIIIVLLNSICRCKGIVFIFVYS